MEVAKGSDSPAEIRGEEERKTVSPAVGTAAEILGGKERVPIPCTAIPSTSQVFLK